MPSILHWTFSNAFTWMETLQFQTISNWNMFSLLNGTPRCNDTQLYRSLKNTHYTVVHLEKEYIYIYAYILSGGIYINRYIYINIYMALHHIYDYMVDYKTCEYGAYSFITKCNCSWSASTTTSYNGSAPSYNFRATVAPFTNMV